MQEDTKQAESTADDDAPIKLYTCIQSRFEAIHDILYEIGVQESRYALPAFVPTMRTARLQRVLQALISFCEGEYMLLFKAAVQLHPPGVLARWASDSNMRSARDVSLYVQTRSLLRRAWHENSTLKSFFKVNAIAPRSS